MSGSGPSTRTILRVVLIIVISGIALYLIYRLRTPITWIVVGAFIAVTLSAPVGILQKRLKRRGLAIATVYLGLILVPVVFAAVLVPPLVTETNKLIDELPTYARDVRDAVQENKTLRRIENDYDITGTLQKEAEKLPSKLGDATGVLSDIGFGIVNSLFALLTILILSAFMIGSGGKWADALIASRPPPEHEMLHRASHDISAAVIGYVAGALGQAIVAGVSSFVVLTILGVPYAPALALIIALLDIVPLVGATLGAVVVGIVTLFNDFPTATIVWAIFSLVYQQTENNVIQPMVYKRTVDVHPLVVIISILVGAALLGVLGALVAIPVAGALQIVVRYLWRRRGTSGIVLLDENGDARDATESELEVAGGR